MDAGRFDALTRSVTTAGTRRRALSVALGGALSAVGVLPRNDAVAGGKCKPPCPECKRCKKGKKGKKGKCQPTANGTPCSLGTCQGGVCTAPTLPPPVCRAVQESCASDACCAGLRCDNNFCKPAPVCCGAVGASCRGDDCDCCGAAATCQGGICRCLGIACGAECCNPSAGEVCRIEAGVPTGCQGGGCPVTDFCNDPEFYRCGGNCACVTSTDGQKICSDLI